MEEEKKIKFGNPGFFVFTSLILVLISVLLNSALLLLVPINITVIGIFGSAMNWDNLDLLGKLYFFSLFLIIILCLFLTNFLK